MVLGDGMTRVAPAHRISPSYPGTAWLVEDTGAADRVRADYWPDPLIRDLSTRYATTVQVDLDPAPRPDQDASATFTAERSEHVRERKPRSPRQPRPRPAGSAQAGGVQPGGAA